MNEPDSPIVSRKDSSRTVDNLSRTVSGALTLLGSRLVGTSETASLDASVMLAHVLGKSRAWILAHPEAALDPQQISDLKYYLARLENNDPLPYLLGHWEFYGLDFEITPDVLIPRPETELLVEQALSWLQMNGDGEARQAADIGTGSGCIAVALAFHHPNLRVLASDISLPALQVARRNAIKHHIHRQVDFVQADLFSPCVQRPAGVFDLICANLPYIPTQILLELPVYRHEPSLALDGGASGLDCVERLLKAAPYCLSESGLLLAEIEASQGAAVTSLAREAFPEASIEILKDLDGHDRLLRVERTHS